MKIIKSYKESIICTLKCYNLLLVHIEELKKQLAEVFINDGVSAVDYAGDGIKTNNINKLVENTALKNIEDVERIKNEIDLAQSKLDRLNAAIGSLNIIDRQIVIYRYLKGRSWGEITKELSYSERMCQRKLYDAIDKLAFIFYGERAFQVPVSDII